MHLRVSGACGGAVTAATMLLLLSLWCYLNVANGGSSCVSSDGEGRRGVVMVILVLSWTGLCCRGLVTVIMARGSGGSGAGDGSYDIHGSHDNRVECHSAIASLLYIHDNFLPFFVRAWNVVAPVHSVT